MTHKHSDVLFVSPWNRKGGLATYSQYLVPHLRNHCSVDVYPWDSEPLLVRGTGLLLLTGTFLRRLRNADVVHVQYTFGRYLASLPVLLLLAALFRTPVVITQHERFDNLPFPSALYAYHQLLYILVDRIVVHTEARADLIWDIHHSRVAVVEHGVIHRPDFYREPAEADTVLFPGIIRPIKGHHIAVEAMQHLDDVTLRIVGGVGDQEYYDEICDLVEKLNLSDRVELVPEFVPEQELFRELREANLVILPYENHTSMSGMLSHCISWRVPTLVTDCPAFRSVLPCEEAFFEKRTPEEIATRIQDVSRDLAQQKRLIEQFRDLSEQYSWVMIGERTAEIYATYTETTDDY